jgi:hypothetical protein
VCVYDVFMFSYIFSARFHRGMSRSKCADEVDALWVPREAANVLDKQSRKADKEVSFRLEGYGGGGSQPLTLNWNIARVSGVSLKTA